MADTAGDRWKYEPTTPDRNDPRPGTYVVIRVRGYVPGLPADLDGKWYDLADIPAFLRPDLTESTEVVAHETGRFERRDDGAVAQVFEIRGLVSR